MSIASPTATSAGPLTPEHQRELALAQTRAKKLRAAARTAAFNGWVTAVFAVCSAPFALFSVVGFLATAGLAFVAYNEFQGRKRLLQFDPSAARLLGWNQLGFLALIVLYCLWMLYTGLTGAGPFSEELKTNPELADALGSLDGIDQLYRHLVVVVYGSVIVLSVVFQGLTALYYFTRRKYIEACRRETPAWALDLMREVNAG